VVLGFVFRAYTLSHSASHFFVMGFFEIGSWELFAQAGFKPWSSWSLPSEYLGEPGSLLAFLPSPAWSHFSSAFTYFNPFGVFVFGDTEFKLRALCLVDRSSTTWTTPPGLFAVCFGDRVSLFAQASLDQILSLGWQAHAIIPWPTIGWEEVHEYSFSLGWPHTIILPMSVPQVARIIGVSHLCLALDI
jgi:hypothetical protein